MPYSGSATQRLTAVQSAIDQILSGGAQAYSIRDRRAERAKLETLMMMEDKLLQQVQIEAQGQVASLGQIVPVR